MKVQELLVNIKNKDFKLERGLEVKKYLPMEVKKTIAQAIMYDCTSDEFGVIKVDSVERYMSYVRHMILMHTNLEYSDADYDALCSTEFGDTTLLNAILGCFDADSKECLRILNLVTDDVLYENSIQFTIGRLMYNINNVVGSFSETIGRKMNEFNLNDIVSDDINVDQLKNILNMLNK